MPRIARHVEPLPEETLAEAEAEFQRAALKALEGQIPIQRELADRLGWPETTLSSALKGRRFTFKSWPRICKALGLDPIDELVRGRAELRKSEDEARERAYRGMLDRMGADSIVVFWRTLPALERSRVLEALLEREAPDSGGAPDSVSPDSGDDEPSAETG